MNELGQLFLNYKEEAYRLETLPFYRVKGEWENFEIYKNTGNAIQDEDLKSYLADVKSKIANGAQHIRARVLEVPVNEYQVFETKVGYIPSSELGTAFYFMNRPEFNKILESDFDNSFLLRDFWLFDNKDLAFMNYNESGEWTGFEIVSDMDIISKCKDIRKGIEANSFSLQTLMNKLNL